MCLLVYNVGQFLKNKHPSLQIKEVQSFVVKIKANFFFK